MNIGLGVVSKFRKTALAGIAGAGVLLAHCGKSLEKGAIRIGETPKTDIFQISTKEAEKIISAPNFDTANIQRIRLERPKSSFIMTPQTVAVERKPVMGKYDTTQTTEYIVKNGFGQHQGSYIETKAKTNEILSSGEINTLGKYFMGLEAGVGRKIQTPVDLEPYAYVSVGGKKAVPDTSYFKYGKNHWNNINSTNPISKASYDSAMTSLQDEISPVK